MIKLLLRESKRRVGSPGVFITLGTYFILLYILLLEAPVNLLTLYASKKLARSYPFNSSFQLLCTLYRKDRRFMPIK